MKKRILILALTVSIVFSLIPLGASAALARFDFKLSEAGEVYFTFNTYGHKFISLDAFGADNEAVYTLTQDGDKLTVTLTAEYVESLKGITTDKAFYINMEYNEPKITEFGGELEVNDGKASLGCVWVEDNALGDLYQIFVGDELIDPSLYEEKGSFVHFTDEFLYDESGAQRYEDGTEVSYTFREDGYSLHIYVSTELLEEYFDESIEEPTVEPTETPTVEPTTEEPTVESVDTPIDTPDDSPETGVSYGMAALVMMASALMIGLCAVRAKESE